MRQRGSGTIRKLKSGYQARYMDESGRQVAAPLTFKTKADANLWLSDRQSRQARGTWIDPRAGAEHLRVYGLAWLDTKSYTPRSRETAERLFHKFIVPTLGELPVNMVTPTVVRQWRSALLKETGKPTVRLSYNLLKAIMATAVVDDLLAKNPCQEKGASKVVSSKRAYVSYDECMRIIDHLPEHLQAFAITAWWSSARMGEVLGLRWKDLDLSSGGVHIHRQIVQVGSELHDTEPKWHSDRFVVVQGPGLEALREHKRQAGTTIPLNRVFTNRAGADLTPHAVSQAWRRARSDVQDKYGNYLKANLPHVHFHDLRRSSATEVLRSGASIHDLQRLLGHEKITTTERYLLNDPARPPVVATGLAAHIARVTAGREGEPGVEATGL